MAVYSVTGESLVQHAGEVNDGCETQQTTASASAVRIWEGALVIEPPQVHVLGVESMRIGDTGNKQSARARHVPADGPAGPEPEQIQSH